MLIYSAAITRATHDVMSVDRLKNSRVAILLHEAQAIHCNHFRMKSFYSPFHFPLILWLKVWHVCDRILAEMVLISPNIMAITHHVAWVDRNTVNWTWFPFKMQGVFIVIFSEFRVFILLFVLPLFCGWKFDLFCIPAGNGINSINITPMKMNNKS